MKVEIVSIGTELLLNDILNTNAAYATRTLREVRVDFTCRVTVGDDPEMITNVLQVALGRADVVLMMGGLGDGPDDHTRQAIGKVTGHQLAPHVAAPPGSILLGATRARVPGWLIAYGEKTLICLPGHRREMAYLLETEVLPYLRRRLSAQTSPNWLLLRTVGLMESSLKQQLADLSLDARHRLTFDSFAGQTNIRLQVEADSEEQAGRELAQLRQAVLARLGDHIYGEEADRLEDVVLQALARNNVELTIAECYTGRSLAQTLERVPGHNEIVTLLPTKTWTDLASYLKLKDLTPESDLTGWCRLAAEQLLADTEADLGLVVYNNVTQGGVQVLVTLASLHGVSVTQRSFGGHPENIDHWSCTLGLAHVRRWLLAHH